MNMIDIEQTPIAQGGQNPLVSGGINTANSPGIGEVGQPHILTREERRRMARRQHPLAKRSVQAYRHDLEQRFGVPIKVRETTVLEHEFGRVTPAWGRQPMADHHLIEILASQPQMAKPHVLAHELTHLDLMCRAKDVGRCSTCSVIQDRHRRTLKCINPRNLVGKKKRGKNTTKSNLLAMDIQILDFIVSHAVNIPLDMVVETTIERDIPVLTHSYILVTDEQMAERLAETDFIFMKTHLRPSFHRAFFGLESAYAYFCDRRFGNATDYFAQYRNTEHEALGRALVAEFDASFPTLQPGDEYDFVDRCADLVGLRQLYKWNPILTS
jgi:hypothetical protein